ncbi:hypothetical protein NGB36_05230 [Streptomyces sp. RB6PN25]|uniref:Uncharacterized protein n=1 Tax=Streptomyces humicola TaxID=2953240 RepID=A0ABT1PQR7_9ACTN|nr:hypothetical protein [Streptomyces humicola]MCQ4080009.1 hypothetical protein [Streptomyces humicola]
MHASRLWAVTSLTAAALALGSPAAVHAVDAPAPASLPGHVVTLQDTPGDFPVPGGRGHQPRRHHHRRHHRRHFRHRRHQERRNHRRLDRCVRRVRIARDISARLTFGSWGPRAVIEVRRDGRFDGRNGRGVGRDDRFRHHRDRLVLDARHPRGRIDGLRAWIHRFYGRPPVLAVRLEERREGVGRLGGRGGRDGRFSHYQLRHFGFPRYCHDHRRRTAA